VRGTGLAFAALRPCRWMWEAPDIASDSGGFFFFFARLLEPSLGPCSKKGSGWRVNRQLDVAPPAWVIQARARWSTRP